MHSNLLHETKVTSKTRKLELTRHVGVSQRTGKVVIMDFTRACAELEPMLASLRFLPMFEEFDMYDAVGQRVDVREYAEQEGVDIYPCN